MSRFLGLHHVSFVVRDTALALTFYRDVLGLELDTQRPDLGFPGAWLKTGAQQIHLLELNSVDPAAGRPEHVGRDRHAAFRVSGLDELERCLSGAGVPFTRSRSGRRAIFCRDPDGNGLELIESSSD